MPLFGFITRKESREEKRHWQIDTASQLGERVATAVNPSAHTPNMQPSGSVDADIYVLGEAPGEQEDSAGESFVGLSGRFLRQALGGVQDQARFNNICRTHTPKSRDPTQFEIECYRESVELDIIKTEPMVVLLVGRLTATWLIPESRGMDFNLFRGRLFQCELRGHKFWAVPVFRPAYVLRIGNDKKIGEAIRVQFIRDVKSAKRLIEAEAPEPLQPESFLSHPGTEILTGVKGDLQRLRDFASHCKKVRLVGVDLETSGGRPYSRNALLLSMALATKKQAVSVALDHPGACWSNDKHVTILKRLLSYLKCQFVWHNGTYDLEWLGHLWGWEYVRPGGDYQHWHDTMEQGYTLDHRNIRGKGHSLDFLCRVELGTSFKALAGVDRNNLLNTDINEVLIYNAGDARATLALHFRQMQKLKEQHLFKVYDHQRRRISTVVLAQLHGMPVSQKRAEAAYVEYSDKVKKAEIAIQQVQSVRTYVKRYGRFLPTKDNHQRRLFRDVVGVDLDVGRGSLDADALKEIKDPSAAAILNLRKCSKLLSTYIVGMRKGKKDSYIWPDGYLHPIINTTFTRTGRLSMDSPNLQNQPTREVVAKLLRAMIKMPKGFLILSSDYGQIEWRVVAMASKDQYMIHAINENIDVHRRWALKIANRFSDIIEKIYGSMDDPNNLKAFREVIKNRMVFPAIFLANERYIAKMVGVPEGPFQKIFKQFWDELDGVRRWQERELKFYKAHGYVHSLTGRKYYASSKKPILTNNDIVNYPIQGTAADINVDAMCRLSERAFEEDNMNILPVLQIHDDLTFIVEISEAYKSVVTIVSEMLNSTYDFINVPLEVKVELGADWASQKGIGRFDTTHWHSDLPADIIPGPWRAKV